MHSSLELCVVLAQLVLTPAPAAGGSPKLTPAPAAGGSSKPAPVVEREIVVEAGKFDRQNTVVPVNYPAPANAKLALRDARARIVPLQMDGPGRATFVVENLKAGATATYRVIEQPKNVSARATVDTRDPGFLAVLIDGQPVMQYEGRATTTPRTDVPANLIRAGFIHPLWSPAGSVITESYPIDQHRHLGIFAFWPSLLVENQTIDSWNNPGVGGRVQMESKGPTWEGPVHAGFEARQIYSGGLKSGGKTLLRDTWRVTTYATRPGRQAYFLVDLESEQQAAAEVPVRIPQAGYGGVALRGRGDWNAKGSPGVFRLTSEKGSDRARWAYQGGLMSGRMAGVAMLSHPSNPGAPQIVAASGQPLLNFVPNKERALTIEPMKPLRMRYRFVVTDGQPDARLFERLWNDFAFPPLTQVRTLDGPPRKKLAAQQQ